VSKRYPRSFIHRKAHVQDATLGEGCMIWQFASVTRGAVLGKDCSVAPGAMLDGCRFGDRCRIGPSVSMGPGFLIGDDVFIGPSVTFCNDAWPSADKDGFDAEAMRSCDFVTIRVGDRAIIGANAVILPGVTIGDDAVVAAGAVVDRDVAAGVLFRRDGVQRFAPDKAMRRRMREAKPC
jgi:UDP-2-acetamido-3-amino-2,3-dideoxy-glucuronate N-acetyltransferase